jgi:carboxypeptidase Taq
VLKATKWVTEPGPELDDLLRRIMALREDAYKRLSAPDVAKLLAQAESGTGLSETQQANLRLMRRIEAQVTGIGDMDFIAAMEDTMARTEPAWLATLDKLAALAEQKESGAITEADYRRQSREIYEREQVPLFEKAFDMRRAYCRDVGKKLGIPASQVMLDFWNPYETNADMEAVCAEIERRFPPLVKRTEAYLAAAPALPQLPPVPVERQNLLARTLLARFKGAIGLTEEKIAQKGIILHDPVVYPTGFCWGSLDNIRLSVEGEEAAPLKSIRNAAHEYGHLVYAMALNDQPEELRTQPVGQLNGYGIHEVSATFFEFMAQKKKFFELAGADIRRDFGAAPDDPRWSADNLYKLMNRPSLESMEWGGCELALMPQMAWRSLAERRILDEEMSVADLADFRTGMMSRLTGLPQDKVADDGQVFDSSHWAGEEYGYFYAYITGGMAAAALHEKLERERGPELARAATLEEYLRIHADFMQENVYQYASRLRPREILRQALGAELSLDAYMRHLERGLGEAAPAQKPGNRAAPPGLSA